MSAVFEVIAARAVPAIACQEREAPRLVRMRLVRM
jgi:hypothetical protein